MEQIWRGLSNPSKAKYELSEQIDQIQYAAINAHKRWSQRNIHSSYGLVLNWGHHQLDHWVAACTPYFVKKFIEKFEPVIITSQQMYERRCNDLEYIFSFGIRNKKGPSINYSKNNNQTIIAFLSDPHIQPSYIQNYIRDNEIDYVATPLYNPSLYHLPDLCESRLVHFPWPIPDEHIVQPEEIEYRGGTNVHISGAGGSEKYELRDWCRQQPGVTEHINSGTQNKIMTNDEYYHWLRNFDAAIAAGSLQDQYQYVVPKYYEIAAAGSLLFAQYCEDFERLDFDDSNCVIFRTKEEFKEKLDAYLDDPKAYIGRRKRGADLIASKYTISDRLNDIEALFQGKY
ncbi:glycosyltransferase [Natronomonas sp. F2-12]|uniref:Glycosyltransferase n=1 Tax=Natronomonas aquatica TaxID=2841590 RepID=A0A9R1D7B8_9EURY|nr:glycosyltransferase [Natronomonas aquatica]MCQ4333130.1 glycosyltransferase [Natronomonas aquatica]